MRTRRFTVVFCYIGGLSSAADFDAGMAAYNKKDYVTAIREWRPLADRGDAKAQYQLGNAFAKLRNPSEEGYWKCLAAEQGEVTAQQDLVSYYPKHRVLFNGYDIIRDPAETKWCRILELQGISPSDRRGCEATARVLASKSSVSLQLSDTFAHDWKPGHPGDGLEAPKDWRSRQVSCSLAAAYSQEGTARSDVLMGQGGAGAAKKGRIRTVPAGGLASGGTPQAAEANPEESARIRKEVESIEASAQYSKLPMPQAVPRTGMVAAGMVRSTITNGTVYSLTVLMTGPVSQELVIIPGATQSVTLPVGTYKIAARVPAPNVLPFFGVQQLAGDHDYESRFYIQ